MIYTAEVVQDLIAVDSPHPLHKWDLEAARYAPQLTGGLVESRLTFWTFRC